MKRGIMLVLAALLVCFASPSRALETVTFATGAGALAGTLNVAEAKGFFAAEGIDAKVGTYKSGKDAFDAVLTGKVDVTINNNLGIVLTEFDVSKYRIIATVSYTDNQLRVICRKSSGVARPADLRGKRIGLVPATTSHFYFCKFLVLNGVSCDDAKLVFMKKDKLVPALANGEIDAFCAHGKPIQEAAAALGEDAVVFKDSSIHRKSVQMIAPVDWIEKHPEVVRGVLRAALKGEMFVESNLEESVRIIAESKNYTVEAMDKSVRTEADFNLSLDQALLMTLEGMEQWAIDNKLVKRTTPRNYLDFIDARPLKDVAPDRVTIIE